MSIALWTGSPDGAAPPVAARDGGGAPASAPAVATAAPARAIVVTGGTERDALWARKPATLRTSDGALVIEGTRTVLWAPVEPGREDFTATFELMLAQLSGSGAGVRLDSSVFGLDGPGEELYTAGPLFSGGGAPIPESGGKVRAGVPVEVVVVRTGEWIECRVNGETVMRSQVGVAPIGRIGIWAGRGAVAVGSFVVDGARTRAIPADPVWSAGGDVWDEVSLPSIAALGDGTLLASGSGVRSDEQGKDVRRILVRSRDASGTWGESRVAGPDDLPGSDSTLIADEGAVHLMVQSGGAL